MLRKLLILPLLLSYVLMTCRVAVPLLNYVVNHEYYLEHCENKAKPELDCDGCCQVKKEVAHNADESQQHTANTGSQRTSTTETLEVLYLNSSENALLPPAPAFSLASRIISPESRTLAGFANTPFQPPRA